MDAAGRGLTIVAIPSKDDYVWKISSEKVPHMTILFLGEQTSITKLTRIVDFLQHAVDTELTRFGMSVARRGELGEKQADVLFFDDNYSKNLDQFRSHLLTEPAIFDAYNSVPQYPTWVKHLTLGYPETPAKPDTRDYPGINWVNFDRVALWTNDYDGPEILLDDNSAMEVSMSDMRYQGQTLDDVLAHFGVKGMRWGVRRSKQQISSDDHNNARAAAAKVRKHGTKSLSNKELKDLIDRMSLEKQYKNLRPPSVGHRILGGGARFAGRVLAEVGRTQASRVANEHAARQMARAFTSYRSWRGRR